MNLSGYKSAAMIATIKPMIQQPEDARG